MRRRTIDDRPQEFPHVNESVLSRRHRYGYAAVTEETNAVAMPRWTGRSAQDFTGEPVG